MKKKMNKKKKMKVKKTTILPEDLIIEILVRMPVKSLLRFRCVCKCWYDLIKRPNFINMHLKYHCYSNKNNDCILIRCNGLFSFRSYESPNSVISPDFEIPHINSYGDISWPCNGLVCGLGESNIVLCNPATREFKLLPPHPYRRGCSYVEVIGLGFDSNTNDYKVVALVSNSLSVIEARIYNVSSNLWRQIGHDFKYVSFVRNNGAPSNGAYHWIAQNRYDGDYFILCFHMSSEVFSNMELPNHLKIGLPRINLSLTVLSDSLALFAYTSQFVDVWVMKEYGDAKSWTKQFSIRPSISDLWYPRLLWKNEAILLHCLPEKLVLCALDTHQITDWDKLDWNSIKVMVYQESLISIKESLISIK